MKESTHSATGRPVPAGADRALLVRLEGPGEATGQLSARSISYDFKLGDWVKTQYPGSQVAAESIATVADRPGRRFILDRSGARELLFAFIDRDTLFTLRLAPLGAVSERGWDKLSEAIHFSN